MADTGIPLLPPAEAIDYFRKKGFRTGFAWQDVWQEEHVRAFTVAKAMSADVLETIRAEVDKALADGRTLAQFRAELTPLLQKMGWWGRKRMIDPATGLAKTVQLGSPRRLKIIYDMNMRMARAAGLWSKIQRTKDALPYLRYTAVMDDRTRPEHAEWHGTILPVDDPWWDTHYPPCGWNCRCTVIQIDAGTIADRGWEVSSSPPPEGKPAPWTNPRTGEVVDVPAGIDPGFAYNVGKAAAGGLEPPPLLPPELPALEPGVEAGAVPAGAPAPASMLPAGIDAETAIDAFLAEAGAAPSIGEPVATLTGTELAPADASIGTLREAAAEAVAARRETGFESPRLGNLRVTRAGIKKARFETPERAGGADKLRATPALEAVIAHGEVTTEPNLKPEQKPRVLRVARIRAPISLDGEVRMMEVRADRYPDGWHYANHMLLDGPSGRPVVGGVSGGDGRKTTARRIDPTLGDRSASDIAASGAGVEDRNIEDPSGWRLALGPGWFRDMGGALAVPSGDRRRVLPLVGRAIARPDQIRLRWVTGADGSKMLFRRYIAKVDGMMVVVDVGKAGWRFATERDPGFDLRRLTVGTVAWTASQ